MSSALYAVRLLWNGTLGLAKHDGVSVDLTAWPAAALPGVPVAELNYTPETRWTEVRESAGSWRPMTHDEKAAVFTWLKRVSAAARAAINE